MKDCKDCKFLKGTRCTHATATKHYNAKVHRNNYPTEEPDCGPEAKFFEPIARERTLRDFILFKNYDEIMTLPVLEADTKAALDKEDESILRRYPHLAGKDGKLMSKEELEACKTTELTKDEIIDKILIYATQLRNIGCDADSYTNIGNSETQIALAVKENKVTEEFKDFLKEHIKVPE